MPTSLPQKDRKVMDALKKLGLFEVEYPLEHLAIRRAVFRSEAKRLNKRAQKLVEQKVITHLENLGTVKTEYDPQLLAARRAIFSNQIRQQKDQAEQSKDQKIIKVLESLRGNQAGYPERMLPARRSAFLSQVTKKKWKTWLEAFRSHVQNVWNYLSEAFQPSMRRTIYTTLVLAVLVFVASIGTLRPRLPEHLRGVSQAFVFSTNNAPADATPICDASSASSCLTALNNVSPNLSSQRNGFARAAVAKDGTSGIHRAAFANDGLYGNGSSWVSQSPYSWLKIDLGKATLINTVAISQGANMGNQPPGEFIISTALSDNAYANGDSSNDNVEFQQVYDSQSARYIGDTARSGTLIAYFEPVNARYIKITFANAGTTIDEVEIFMSNSISSLSKNQAKEKGGKSQSGNPGQPTNTLAPTLTLTAIPSNTPLPTSTWTLVPTNTLPPTLTPSPIPTDTLVPTDTATPVPTDTATEMPLPTDTPQPPDTDTPVPTDTVEPIATDTPFIISLP
jgi:F5/8 type C domain-containing protein